MDKKDFEVEDYMKRFNLTEEFFNVLNEYNSSGFKDFDISKMPSIEMPSFEIPSMVVNPELFQVIDESKIQKELREEEKHQELLEEAQRSNLIKLEMDNKLKEIKEKYDDEITTLKKSLEVQQNQYDSLSAKIEEDRISSIVESSRFKWSIGISIGSLIISLIAIFI